jgi:PAS domain S-box-containing protein
LAEGLADAVYLLQVDTLAKVVDGLTEQEDINAIAVFDNGGLLYHNGNIPGMSSTALEKHFIDHSFFETANSVIEYSGETIAGSAPVRLGDEIIGHVLVNLSLAPIEEQIALARKQQDLRVSDGLNFALWTSLGITLIFGGLGVVLAVFVGDRLSRPIDMLARIAGQIGRGDYDVPQRIQGPAEIRELARSFHSMARNLRDTTVSKAHLDNILYGMLDGLLVVDANGTVITANKAAGRLLGYQAVDLIGQPVASFFDEPLAGQAETVGRPRESNAKTINGDSLPVLLSISDIRERTAAGASTVWVFRDITGIKAAQDTLVAAVMESERANRAKSQFLANMSHELRTPLNAIIGYSEMLAEEAREKGQDGTTDDLNRIHAAGRHLLGLVNDVLDLSKIEAGKMDLDRREIRLQQLIEDVALTVKPLMDEQGNDLEIILPPDLPPILSDETRVRQIVYNILSNAAKFTRNGSVTVTVNERTDDDGGRIAIDIADTGIGMSADQLDRIFGEFVQADSSTTREYGGTGLGLAISHQLAQMLGGNITVKSVLGAGSIFTIWLPLGLSDSAAKGTRNARQAPAISIRTWSGSGNLLLVAHGDPNRLDWISRQVASWGFGVVSASQSAEGIRLVRKLRPMALIIDRADADPIGQQVAAGLTNDVAVAQTPAIVLPNVDDEAAEVEQLAEQLTALLPAMGSRSVLIVEDDAAIRQRVVKSMQDDGWQVCEAEDARTALKRVRTDRPDLIVVDLKMPLADGDNLLYELKGDPDTAAVPVLVVTEGPLNAGDRMKLQEKAETVIEKNAGPWIETVRIMGSMIGRKMYADHVASGE